MEASKKLSHWKIVIIIISIALFLLLGIGIISIYFKPVNENKTTGTLANTQNQSILKNYDNELIFANSDGKTSIENNDYDLDGDGKKDYIKYSDDLNGVPNGGTNDLKVNDFDLPGYSYDRDVKLFVADLDKNGDKSLELIKVSTSTDVSADITIYRYNGKSIVEVASIITWPGTSPKHMTTNDKDIFGKNYTKDFKYNGDGKLYFMDSEKDYEDKTYSGVFTINPDGIIINNEEEALNYVIDKNYPEIKKSDLILKKDSSPKQYDILNTKNDFTVNSHYGDEYEVSYQNSIGFTNKNNVVSHLRIFRVNIISGEIRIRE